MSRVETQTVQSIIFFSLAEQKHSIFTYEQIKQTLNEVACPLLSPEDGFNNSSFQYCSNDASGYDRNEPFITSTAKITGLKCFYN